MAYERGGSICVSVGVAAGLLLGVGCGALLAPASGPALRRGMYRRARQLTYRVADCCSRVGESAADALERGRAMVERVRAAGAEGVRAARAQLATPLAPGQADLVVFEGLADAFNA